MNRKISAISILAVFMLVAITFVTTVSSNTNTTVKKRESPLFGIRTKLAIGERLQNLRDGIKAKFVGDRVFFLPFEWLKNVNEFSERNLLAGKTCTQNIWCTSGPCTSTIQSTC
jgi:hypothetical protein